MFLNTLKAPYYDRMIGNSNTNFFDVVSAREMIESGVKLGKIKGTEAKKPTLKKKEGETHVVSYQEKAYNPFYSRQPNQAIKHTTNMLGVTHKGITSPILGQWLVSLPYLHLLMEGLLNHRANMEIMLEEQGLNKKGPSLTPSQ